MQRKPDKEGYKLYALCDKKTAFVYDFFPSGRLEKVEVKEQVDKLVHTLPGKQSIDYIIAMDNFFTTPKVIESLREQRVGVVGTARRRRGWNPFDDVRDEKEFNSLYLINDRRNFLIARWIDNSEVLMVSTVHTGELVVDSHRKRPRETQYNRDHVRALFGNDGEKTIEIPKIIDDYNNWMGGVDLANQLISQYKPQFRCRRTWVPLFLQAQDIVRMNSYVAAKALGYQKEHKQWVCSWIEELNNRANTREENARRTRAAAAAAAQAQAQSNNNTNDKRPRMGKRKFNMVESRFEEGVHVMVKNPDGSQQRCHRCAFLLAKSKKEGAEPHKFKRVRTMCAHCNVPLCSECFTPFHTPENN
jgi:hypothetical protein